MSLPVFGLSSGICPQVLTDSYDIKPKNLIRLQQITAQGTNILCAQPAFKNQEYFLKNNVAFKPDFYEETWRTMLKVRPAIEKIDQI